MMLLLKKKQGERGIAIIVVLLIMAAAWTMCLFFFRATIVDSYVAHSHADRLRAEFLARSSMAIAESQIRLQMTLVDTSPKVQEMINSDSILDYSDQVMCLFSASVEEKNDLGGGIKGLMASSGEMAAPIVGFDGKINLNCAGKPNKNQRKALHDSLQSLMAHTAYDEFFQSEDASGWRRDRQKQVEAIIDYVDPDTTQYGADGVAEQYGYGNLKDSYSAHNNYLDTVDEARMIRGVDDKFWALFGDEFTVYGDCKVNIGSVESVKMIAGLILYSAKNPEDPVLRDQVKFWQLAGAVQEVLGMPAASRKLQDFIDTVKDPQGLEAMQALGEGAAQMIEEANIEPVEGIELDIAKLRQVANEDPRRIYKVVGEGTAPTFITYDDEGHVDNVQSMKWRITGIWDAKRPGNPVGGWVYWREE